MRINHDFHIHTKLSLCADREAEAKRYIEKAKKIGLKKIGFANHFWDEKIPANEEFYEIQTFKYNLALKEELERLDKSGVEVYFGLEGEYHPVYGVAITPETAEQLDFLIVSNSHTHKTMDPSLYKPYEKHAQFMAEAYNNILDSDISKYILAIAHPFEAVCCPYDKQLLFGLVSDDTYKALFTKTAEKGIAVEINTSTFGKITAENIEKYNEFKMFDIAKKCGCKFIFGSDAHSNRDHDNYLYLTDLLSERIGLTEKDIIEFAR